jgi:hypothetical protein
MMNDRPELLEESSHLIKVRAFMMAAGQNLGEPHEVPPLQDRRRQAELIAEEAGELIGGLGFSITYNLDESEEGFDLVEAIDGALDLRVVSTGVLAMIGLPDVYLQEIVDENNLGKFGPGHSWDTNGKLLKPPRHQPPAIAQAIEEITLQQEGGSQ